MPSGEEIQRYLSGAWHLMLGRREGLKLLDLSADGFWNSFYAMIVALPMMFFGWVTVANGYADAAGDFGDRFSILLRLAFIDVLAWIAPLVLLAFLARPLGIADRFVGFVVATNWGSVIVSAIMLPLSLLDFLFSLNPGLIDALSLFVFIAVLVLNWRMTNAAIDRGAGTATAVFALVLVASIAVVLLLQGPLGLIGAQAAG